jgi:hypothetical protein
MHIIIGMPPHIIITGAPMAIMEFMASQRSFMRDIIEASVGIIFIIMPSFVISQDILHIMGIIMPIIMPFIIGIIMPFIIGMPFIIDGIMPFIMGIMPFIMGIIGMPFIGIAMGICIGMLFIGMLFIGIPIIDIGMAFISLSPIVPFGSIDPSRTRWFVRDFTARTLVPHVRHVQIVSSRSATFRLP